VELFLAGGPLATDQLAWTFISSRENGLAESFPKFLERMLRVGLQFLKKISPEWLAMQ
jgi:hypothetical protein